MPSPMRLLAMFLGAFSMLAVSALPAPAQEQPMVLPVDPAPLLAETGSGPARFTVEIADDPDERSRGLMHRARMAETHGMLFVFETTRPVGFWMQNTPLALDLVFIGEDGRVIDILPGEPYSPALIAPDAPARFVLELNAGIAQKTGIEKNVRIRHPVIDRIAGDR